MAVVVPDFVSLAGPALAGWATGEPDLEPLTGDSTWQDVGRSEARKPRR